MFARYTIHISEPIGTKFDLRFRHVIEKIVEFDIIPQRFTDNTVNVHIYRWDYRLIIIYYIRWQSATYELKLRDMKEVVYPNNRGELKVGNVTYRSFYDNRVTEDDLEKARLELGETEEVRSASLRELRDMLKRDKAFCYRLDDEYLLRYLRFKKYNVKKAYTFVRKFYAFRKERPDLFTIPSDLELFLSRDFLKCMPYKENGGHPIYLIDSNPWKLEELSFEEIFTFIPVCADIITMNPSNHINGVIAIFDLGGLTSSHIYRYAYPSALGTFLKILQSSYPWRIKKIIGFKCNPVLRGLYYTFKFLLTKKVAERVELIGSDVKELHRYVNPRLLPKAYGGCIETSECNVQQFIKDNLPYVKYERSFGLSKTD